MDTTVTIPLIEFDRLRSIEDALKVKQHIKVVTDQDVRFIIIDEADVIHRLNERNESNNNIINQLHSNINGHVCPIDKRADKLILDLKNSEQRIQDNIILYNKALSEAVIRQNKAERKCNKLEAVLCPFILLLIWGTVVQITDIKLGSILFLSVTGIITFIGIFIFALKNWPKAKL